MNKEDQETIHKNHYSEGDKLFNKEEYSKALCEFEEALKFRPGDSDTLWAIAGCYSELGKPDIAEEFYRKSLENAPSNKRDSLIYNIGNALYDQSKYKEAITQYESIPKESKIYKMANLNIKASKKKIGRY